MTAIYLIKSHYTSFIYFNENYWKSCLFCIC